MSATQPAAFVALDGRPVELMLYMFAGCPFCQKVLDSAESYGWTLPQRDIRRDPEAKAELLRIGGKATVPCLIINGKPLYESDAIATFLATQLRH